MNTLGEKAAQNLIRIRENRPVIHNITNYVVMNFTANVLLAMGAAPVMAHAENEVAEMVLLSRALVLNIGTLSDPWINAMMKASQKAAEVKIPVILDPVGSGATSYRTGTASKLLNETRIDVIRGNASEIMSLYNSRSKTRGVDSVNSVEEATEIAKTIAEKKGTVVAITGPTDFVTDGNRCVNIENGHPLMACITGTGCASTAITGAFCAVDDDAFTATATALAFFGFAGEKAGRSASAPGSFMTALIDALFLITPEELKDKCRFTAL
jgi:hydroxyethylthiazole kinase